MHSKSHDGTGLKSPCTKSGHSTAHNTYPLLHGILSTQQLLDVLHLFCRLFDMEVNLKPHKTCIVIFRPSGTRLAKGLKWYYNGQEVHVSDNYVDLGALHHATKGIRPACDALASSGGRAMHALLSQCRQHHIVQPDFKLRLFDILVEPCCLMDAKSGARRYLLAN